MLNGTFYVVSDDPDSIPERRHMISSAAMIYNGVAAEAERIPTDKNMRIIDTQEASQLFGTSADRLDGVTVWEPVSNITTYS